MTERVIVDMEDGAEAATAIEALEAQGCIVEDRGGELVVYVPDSRDAVEEVTEALNRAAVFAYVYEEDR